MSEKPVRMLIIEDDLVDRKAVERFVGREKLAWETTFADCWSQGRALLREGTVWDVVVTDYYLGDATALDVLEEAPGIPVIVVTGAGAEDIAVGAMRAGAADYISKDLDRGYLKILPVLVEKALRRHHDERELRLLSQALTSIHDAVWVSDPSGLVRFVNRAFSEIYGYEPEAILGSPESILWAPDERQELTAADEDSVVLELEGVAGECWHRNRSGDLIVVDLSRSIVRDAGKRITALVNVARDVSERKRWEAVLRESEQRYALAAAGSNDGLWDWNMITGEVYYSSRWKEILGDAEMDLDDELDAWLDRIHPEDRELFETQIQAHLEGRHPNLENEHRLRGADDTWVWVQVRGLAERVRGEAVRVAGSLRDITERKQIEEQMTYASLHDRLTGLPNRVLFMDRLDGSIKRHQRRDDYRFGVVFLDLDRFKVINDSLGHRSGDVLLRAISSRLQSCLRYGDTLARLGGDEFAILLDELESFAAVDAIAQRLQDEFETPFEIEGQEIYTSASLGIALSGKDYETAEEILRDADIAMYRAKSMGRTDRVIFNKDMHLDAVAQLQVETDLRRAVDRQEFVLYYQPIVDLQTGKLRGFEALVRWSHPERGILGPNAFLDVARDTGLMLPIGWWVLHEACRQLVSWKRRFSEAAPWHVNVNLDAKQLTSNEVIGQAEAALFATGLEASDLHLEITESMIIENPTVTAAILARLRERDIGLHIDDFGTGYSSLSQLHRFPIDALKIDRSFVMGMANDPENREIIRTIIALSENLGLQVIAEGVETVEQLEALADLGCEIGQGYLFAKPLSAEEIEDKLKESSWSFPCLTASDSQTAGNDSRPTP